jgi:hypothetical protein
MPNLSSYSFSQLTDLVNRTFEEVKMNPLNNVMRNSSIVKMDSIPLHTGDTKRYAQAIVRNQYAGVRDEWESSTNGKVQYGYEKDAQTYTVSLQISITKHMRDAGKNQEIINRITDLTEVCPATIDLDLSHRLTFAWSTSYTRTAWGTNTTVDTTIGDTLALISASHTLTGSATTFSNQITGNPQFSKWALETAEKSFVEESYSNLGEKVMVKPDTIITSDDPNTINQVRELLKATSNVDSNNAGTFNVYGNKYKHLEMPRLATDTNGNPDTTKRKYWFLASSRNSDFYLGMLNEPYIKTPTDGNNGEDFSSENRNYLTAADYLICVVGAQWIRWSKWDAS